MEFLIFEEGNKLNGIRQGVNEFYSVLIKSGNYKGKWAISPNALLEFPEVFNEIEYEEAEINSEDFEVK
jgi:hypothetical protein